MSTDPVDQVGSALRKSPDIAVVGMGLRFPGASTPGELWENLMAGRTSIRNVVRPRCYEAAIDAGHADESTFPRRAALLDDVECFDANFFGTPATDARLIDPQERLLYECVYHALQDAGLDAAGLRGSKTGVFVGYAQAEYEQLLRRNPGGAHGLPWFGSSSPGYYLANRLSFLFDFNGPSEAMAMSHAASAAALDRACSSLLNRESDVAIVAGVSLHLFCEDYQLAGATVRGEGIGVLILKRPEEARRNHSRVYAIIKGCRQAHRGRSKSPALGGMMLQCCTRANVDPRSVRYIELADVVTETSDFPELEDVRSLFKGGTTDAKQCALGSVLGNIGYLEPASAVAAVIKVALSMYHREFAPSLCHDTTPSAKSAGGTGDGVYIAENPISFDDLRSGSSGAIRAGVYSSAPSGCDAYILLEEPPADPKAGSAGSSSRPELFVLSARDMTQLQESVRKMVEWLAGRDAEAVSFESVIRTLQSGREALCQRIAIIAASKGALAQKLLAIESAGRGNLLGLQDQGIFYGESTDSGASSLARLITGELVDTELERGALHGEWRRIAVLWTGGVAVRWDRLWAERSARIVSLPLYPFARQRHWLEGSCVDSHDAVEHGDTTQVLEKVSWQDGSIDRDYYQTTF